MQKFGTKMPMNWVSSHTNNVQVISTQKLPYHCPMKSSFFLFILLVISPFVGSIHAKTPQTTKKKKPVAEKIDLKNLDAMCQKALSDFNVPGMAVGIVKDGQVILSKGFGVKNTQSQARVDEQTQFAIASNSKSFTAAALAILVDQGKLSWDDPVKKHLPYFEMYDPYVTQHMTVRDLLCHRSGLDTFSGDLIWYGTTYSREEVIQRSKLLEPSFGFRAGYGYNNIHFIAAGEVVEAVSGQTWDHFIKENIFKPLDMVQANTSITSFTPESNIASPHNEVDGVNQPIEWVNWDNVGPAGSINAGVQEMTRWLMLQLGKGSLEGKTYWKEQRAFEMWENQTPKPVGKWQREHMPSRHFNGYGLGWELMEYGGRKIVSHGGGYDGMISKTVLVPEENLGFVILTNNINSLPSMLTFEILDLFLKPAHQEDWYKLFQDMRNEGIQDSKQAEADDAAKRQTNTKPSLPMQAYVGVYSSEMYGDVKVYLSDAGELQIDFAPTALFKGHLVHWHFDTFQLKWSTKMMLPPGKVTFVLDKDGKPTEMKVVVENPDFDFSELKLVRKI
jgi:CubicO group peptidase (beta-lactamase class C family)